MIQDEALEHALILLVSLLHTSYREGNDNSTPPKDKGRKSNLQ